MDDTPEINPLLLNFSQSPNLLNYSLQNVVHSLIMDTHVSNNNNNNNWFPVLKATKGHLRFINVFHQLFSLSIPRGSYPEYFIQHHCRCGEWFSTTHKAGDIMLFWTLNRSLKQSPNLSHFCLPSSFYSTSVLWITVGLVCRSLLTCK